MRASMDALSLRMRLYATCGLLCTRVMRTSMYTRTCLLLVLTKSFILLYNGRRWLTQQPFERAAEPVLQGIKDQYRNTRIAPPTVRYAQGTIVHGTQTPSPTSQQTEQQRTTMVGTTYHLRSNAAPRLSDTVRKIDFEADHHPL